MPKHLRLFRPEAREADFPVQFPPPVSHINCLARRNISRVPPTRYTYRLSGAFVSRLIPLPSVSTFMRPASRQIQRICSFEPKRHPMPVPPEATVSHRRHRRFLSYVPPYGCREWERSKDACTASMPKKSEPAWHPFLPPYHTAASKDLRFVLQLHP